MAEKQKKESSDLVVTCPLAVVKGKDGKLHHFYEGALVPEDFVDEEHLKQLRDEGSVGDPESDK